jgi:O-antigen/teichoic acid export membrane protein
VSASLAASVRQAVIWRSGSQAMAQLVAWGSTLAVVRILEPADYGLFAMSQVVLAFLSFLNGYGFASALIQDREIDTRKVRQAFGMLLLVNGALAAIQLALAPLAAAWYRQPVVADMLQVQTLIFLATPFIAIPEVLLIREMDFRRPAIVNFVATAISAAVALGCALAGLGVWTLVYAPIAFFWSRAVGLTRAARCLVMPSFRFAGAGRMFSYGLAILGSQLFWTVVTQSDVFIASRSLDPHQLGLYAEALFLTTIIAWKFVPPLNEVAFPAYSRLQDDLRTLSASFVKAVRLIMLVTCPLYFGLAVVASDAVQVVLGGKWAAMAPLVSVLALAMPAMTLHILFAPALSAVGQPRISMQASLLGALVMPLAFFLTVGWGAAGLAWAWLLAFPVVPLFTFLRSRRILAITAAQLGAAIAPGLGAGAAMALPLHALSVQLTGWDSWTRLALLVAAGGLIYTAILYTVSRATLLELVALVIRRRSPPAEATA